MPLTVEKSGENDKEHSKEWSMNRDLRWKSYKRRNEGIFAI